MSDESTRSVCPMCGHPNSADDAVCDRCGSSLLFSEIHTTVSEVPDASIVDSELRGIEPQASLPVAELDETESSDGAMQRAGSTLVSADRPETPLSIESSHLDAGEPRPSAKAANTAAAPPQDVSTPAASLPARGTPPESSTDTASKSAPPAKKRRGLTLLIVTIVGFAIGIAAAIALVPDLRARLGLGSAEVSESPEAPPAEKPQPTPPVEEDASADPEPVEEPPPRERLPAVPSTDRVWAKGNWWVYRVTTSGTPSDTFFVRWTVSSIATGSKGPLVELAETGGAYDRRTRHLDLEVKDDTGCAVFVKEGKSVSPRMCVDAATPGSLVIDELAYPVAELEHASATWAVHPKLGVVRFERNQGKETLELVGYGIGDTREGMHELEPVVCDWDRVVRASRSEKRSITLSGNYGATRVLVEASSDGGRIVVKGEEKKKFPFSVRPRWVKAWEDKARAVEYVFVHLQADEAQAAMFSYSSKGLERHWLMPASDSQGVWRLQLAADESECFLRVRADAGGVAHFRFRPDGLVRDGGELPVTFEERP